ncbi:hypothetical protein B0H21DRAFT_543831 [Amylocystis lapponica]|nr:hypothetical protein B0H21DRAFT_543831 [Amylocystis lapponica]
MNCKHWFWFEGFSGPVIASLLGEAMFLMRIYASYGKSHLILVLIGALYFGEFVLAFVADRLEVGSTFTIPRPTNYPIPGCLASLPQYTHLALASWIYSMVVACVYFALTMFKFAQNVMFAIRNSPKSFLSLGEFKKLTPILFLFVRDGALYFLAVLLCDVINLVFIAGVSNSPIEQMGTAWMMATYAVASSRLCLNLRSSLGTVGGMTTDIEMQGRTLESNFRFATAPSDIVTTTSATN